MTRRRISAILILILCLSLIIPTPMAMASDRIEFSMTQAIEYITGGTRKFYGSTMLTYAGAGATFSVETVEAGTYDVLIRASTASEAKATACVKGEDAPIISFNTESEQTYREILLNTVKLKKGVSTLDITVTSGYALITHVYLVKTEEVKAVFSKTSGPFRNHWLPAIIQAEDFDYDAATSQTNTRALNQSHRNDSPLTITEETGRTIVSMNRGDTMSYTINVQDSGIYNMSAYAASSGDIYFYFDGNPGYVTASLEPLKETEICAVYLTGGVHVVKAECASKTLDLDKIRFRTSKGTTSYLRPSDLTEGSCIIIEPEDEEKQNPVWKELYVSTQGTDKGDGSENRPFSSMSAAKEAVKKLAPDMKGDIVINILPGIYPVTEKMTFTTEDSGKNGYNIVYRGVGEDKPILSGGKKIEGWQKTDDKIWMAKVSEDIDLVRQLYINEYPASMARSKYLYGGGRVYNDPETEFEQDGFYISKKNFPELTNGEDVELIYPYNWVLHYLPLSGIEDAGNEWLIKYDQPYYGRFVAACGSDAVSPMAGCDLFISNAPELIDEPGEFYFDKKTKTVYYYAFPEEDMTTAEVYTPITEGLITIKGTDKTRKVENLVFDNLDFRHGAWNDVARTGICSEQGDVIFSPDHDKITRTVVPAQIEVNFADNLSVINCNFINLGSTAVALRNCVTNSGVNGNIFRDLAGSAVVVGDTRYSNSLNTVEDTSRHVSVKNNLIRRIGHDYMSSLGIMILYANSVDAMHNDIRYTPYTGISIGWGWGAAISRTLKCGEHMIEANRIDYNSQAARDGASIYTLGSMKGMYIQGNYLSNSPDSGGIYFDSGSEHIVARDNVFDNNKNRVLNAGKLIWDVYRNYANYVDNGSSSPWRSGTDEKKAMVTERPIRTEGNNWSPEAKAIIANAGLQDEYKHLMETDKIDYPKWRTMSIQKISKKRFTSDSSIIVYASDWIPGGEGVAYHKLNGKKPEDYGNKHSFVGNTKTGEWIKYNLPIKSEGDYDINMRYSLVSTDSCKVNIYIDGEKICDAMEIGSTGTWDAYMRIPVGKTYLTEGDHELMLEFPQGAFAVLCFEANYSVANGNDESYDDGIMFKLPQ